MGKSNGPAQSVQAGRRRNAAMGRGACVLSLARMRKLQNVCRAAMCIVATLILACSLMPAAALQALGSPSGLPHAGVAVAADDGTSDDEEARRQAEEEAARQAEEEARRQAEEEAARQAAEEEARRQAEEEAARQAEEEAARQAAEEEAARQAAEEEAARKAAEEEAARKAAEEAAQGGTDPVGGTQVGGKTRTLQDMDVYVTETNSYGEWGRELNRKNKGTKASPQWWLKDGIKEKGGQVKLLVYAYWSGGRACRQDDRENWVTVDLQYASSDTRVATVSNAGVITATGDGTVEISVTERASGITASIFITVSGQAGPLVSEVWVCDSDGRQHEEERVVYNDFTSPLPLYVREVFSDGTTASNAPGASDYAPKKLTEIGWSVNNDMAKISAGEGTLTATKEAREAATTAVTVTAAATGGDPEVKGGVVRGHAYILIKGTGVNTSGRWAADSLTINVVYDAYPDYVVDTKTFSIGDLQELQTVQSTYTMTRSSGGYVTASGEGIYLTTLIEQMDLKNQQVKSFTFSANDGVNPGKMTYSFLFGERYWWPNYEFGGNLSEAVNVFPMLAWASDWRESKSGATNCNADYSNLSDNGRLRLLFGSETTSDNKTDHSLKYISGMTIRIDGAPDITDGEGEAGANADGKDESDNNEGTIGAGKSGGSSNGSTTGGSKKTSSANGVGGERKAATSANQTAITNNNSSQDAKGENAGQVASGSSQKWRVYQMLNPFDETEHQIEELNDNPLAPLVPYLLVLLLALGGAERWLNYKRETAPWPQAMAA